MTRPFSILDVEQRSPEWTRARCGLVCSTYAKDMLAKVKQGEAAARRDLRTRLVVERLTGQPQEDAYINVAMQRGIDKENDARLAYEVATGRLVATSGFLTHASLKAGCSLDGHCGDFEGIVECKAPKSATHLAYLRSDKVPAEHMPQIMHALWLTGSAWADFVSFDDRYPSDLQLVIRRIRRADVDLNAYELALRLFLKECDQEFEAVQALRKAVAA